jgi:hypothetical protein
MNWILATLEGVDQQRVNDTLSYDVPYFERFERLVNNVRINTCPILFRLSFEVLSLVHKKKKTGCSLLVTMLRPASRQVQRTSHRLVRCPSLVRYTSATSQMRSEVCLFH